MSKQQIIRQAVSKLSIPPKDTGSSTVNGSSVDTLGYGQATVRVALGATDETVDFKVQHDVDDGAGAPAGTWADLTGAAFTQFSATDDNKNAVGAINLNSSNVKRHLRVVAVPGGGTSSFVTASIDLSDATESIADATHGTSPAGLAFNI